MNKTIALLIPTDPSSKRSIKERRNAIFGLVVSIMSSPQSKGFKLTPGNHNWLGFYYYLLNLEGIHE